MLYKRFSPLINYDQKYRSIRKFYLNPDSSEGCGRLKLSAETRGSFTHNPYWIYGLIHFASFILHVNSLELNDGTDVQYILEGWESLRIAKELSST